MSFHDTSFPIAGCAAYRAVTDLIHHSAPRATSREPEVAAGCGKKKSDEKLAEGMMERTLKSATGEKADVDVNGENVTITTPQGRVETITPASWLPTRCPSSVCSSPEVSGRGSCQLVALEGEGALEGDPQHLGARHAMHRCRAAGAVV